MAKGNTAGGVATSAVMVQWALVNVARDESAMIQHCCGHVGAHMCGPGRRVGRRGAGLLLQRAHAGTRGASGLGECVSRHVQVVDCGESQTFWRLAAKASV